MDESPQKSTPVHDDSLIGGVLAGWCAANPRIRRAWAYQVHNGDVGERDANDIYVLLDVEPVMDSEEVLPVWLARRGAWQLELQARAARTVHLGWLGPDDTAIPDSADGGTARRNIGVWFSRSDA